MIRFSIIITTYNYGKYIESCLNSCLNQKNIFDFEVIVVDDGSTDGTKLTLEKYTNSNLTVYYINNSGIEHASNFGILKAKGKYIVRVDADDLLGSNFLFEVSEAIKDDSVYFYYSNYFTIDAENKLIEEILLPRFDKNEIFERGDFLATGTVYNKQSLINIGLYSENVRNCGLENYELILKMLQSNYSGVLIEKSLFSYRRHASNLSETRRDSIIRYGNELFKKMGLGKYRTNSNHPYKLSL